MTRVFLTELLPTISDPPSYNKCSKNLVNSDRFCHLFSYFSTVKRPTQHISWSQFLHNQIKLIHIINISLYSINTFFVSNIYIYCV